MEDRRPSHSGSPERAQQLPLAAGAGSAAAASSTQHQAAHSSAANSSDGDVASCATSSRLATPPLLLLQQAQGEQLGERIVSPLPPLPRPWAQQVQQQQQQLCPAAPGEDSAAVMMMMGRSFSLPSSCSSQSLSLMGEQDSSLGGSGTSQQQPPAEPEQQQQPALLQELGVSMETVLRLFSGGCAAEFDQPVWMVVNLQGKVKGSYTSAKMVEFVKRGTLSSAQALLGIDRNLPYITRQELSYYRRLDQLLTAVHGGAVYEPLTQQAVQHLRQLGVLPSQWQPTVRRPQQQQEEGGSAVAAAAEQFAGLQLRADSGSSTSSAAAAVPVSSSSGSSLASARLQAALERLCGCSIAAARQEEPCTPASAAAGKAGRADTAAAAAAEPRACPAVDAAAQRSPQRSAQRSSPPAATDGAQTSSTPMWLYINHLGWCRGPFPGAKVVQAHLCGRLPRDTLLAALEPDLPHSLLTVDVGYFFRPLGVLLDNVANGWRYKPVGWRDVAIRGMDMNTASTSSPAGQQQLAAARQQASPQPWQPLVWDGPGPPPELINSELLQPPLNAPSQAQAMGDRTGGGRRGQQRSEATSSSTSSSSSRTSRRQRQCWSPVQQPAEPLAAPSQQLQQHRHVPRPPMAYLLPPAASTAASGYAAALHGLGLSPMQQQQQYAPASMAAAPVDAYPQPLPYATQGLSVPAPALPPLVLQHHHHHAPLLLDHWAMQLQGGEQQLLAHTLAQQQLLQQVSAAQHLEGQHLVAAPQLQEEQLLWLQGPPSIGSVHGFVGDAPLHGLPTGISPGLATGAQGPFGLMHDPTGSAMAGLHQQQQEAWAAMQQQQQQYTGTQLPQAHLQPTSSPEQALRLPSNYPLS